MYRFFSRSKETGEILHVPSRFITECWLMLKQLNGTKNLIDVTAFRETALKMFNYYVEVFSVLLYIK